MSSSFSKSTTRQFKAGLLPCLLTMSLICGANVFAVTAAASPVSKQLAMTTGAGPAYSVVKLGPASSSCLNASGQVAFTIGDWLSAAAYFYNGAQFQNLGTLGDAGASAYAINDYGQVVGVSSLSSRGYSMLLSKPPMNGTPNLSLGSPCFQIQLSLINSKARSAGSSIAAGSMGVGPGHAFLWTPAKGMVDLGTLSGDVSSLALGINNAGQVIGFSASSFVPTVSGRGFFWSATDSMIDLGAASGVTATPFAINNAGQVVGSASPPSGPSYAFLWTKANGMVNVGGLGSDTISSATAINNKGQVVGASVDANRVLHLFSWTQAGGIIDLGAAIAYPFFPMVNELGQVMLPSSIWTSAGGKVDLGSLGGGNTTAAAINNLGQVVGSSSTTNQPGPTHAFLWTSTGGMVDLNIPDLPVGTTLKNAFAIADNGSILATSNNGDTYLLVPNTRRITFPPSESIFQKSPFQRLAPGTRIFQ